MGAQSEPDVEPAGEPEETVAWIGRDRQSFERVTPPEARASEVVELPARSRGMWFGIAGLLTVGLAAGAAYLMSRASTPPAITALAKSRSIQLVSVMTPTAQPVSSTVTFTGAIAARYDMPIGIDGDAGRILQVLVEAGDHVRRGQLLATLDDSVLIPQINRLAASLEQAKAQAALSEAEYRRAKAVESAGALSAEDIEKRHAASLTDAASVKVAEAQLAEAQARLARTHVLAPVDGLVLTRHAEVGQIASPGGDALFRVASGGEVEMRGQIAEQDLASVKVGQSAQVYLTGVAEPFEGRVRLLGAVIDPQTRLGDIRVSLKPDPTLRPGAFARGSVTISQARRPIVPLTAVMSDTTGAYVYVVNPESRVERRQVRIGGSVSDGMVISEGLTGHEQVIANAGGFLREGEAVSVAQPTHDSETPSAANSGRSP